MGRTVNRPSLSFWNHWLEYLLVIGACVLVACAVVQWALPWVSANLLMIIGIGAISLLGLTAPWTARYGFRAFRAVSQHRQGKAYHEAQLKILAATTQQITAGYNVEIINGRSNDRIKIDNPYAHGRGAITIEQVEDLLEQRLSLSAATIAMPSIEAPSLSDVPRDALHLSSTYNVPADDVLSGRKLFVGVSGSGKSNSIGAYGEELGRLKVPFVLADTEDEYQALCNSLWLSNGILASATGRYSVLPSNATDFGRFILDNQLQVILNLQSYDMPVAAMVMVGIISGMRQWQEEKENEHRIPSDFILEEAVTWLPQNVKESPLHGLSELATLQGTIFNDMVRKGRKRGLGISLVCQRIAELDKRALQSDTKLLHRQTEDTDLKLYMDMGVSRDETLALGNGEAYLFTSRVSKMKIQVRKRYSPHGANTPGLENLRRHQQASHSIPETPKYFGETPFGSGTTSNSTRNAFAEPTEPVSGVVSAAMGERVLSTNTTVEGVPESIRKDIENLYSQGTIRTKIQEKLNLNGDQYWMIKAVCDASDQSKNTTRRA